MKNLRFFAIWAPSQPSQSQNGEDASSGIGGQEFSSRIQRIHRIHYFPPDPAEMVSGAAVQTLPNHAQESQDDVSSQANSLKLWQLIHIVMPPQASQTHKSTNCRANCLAAVKVRGVRNNVLQFIDELRLSSHELGNQTYLGNWTNSARRA